MMAYSVYDCRAYVEVHLFDLGLRIRKIKIEKWKLYAKANGIIIYLKNLLIMRVYVYKHKVHFQRQ